MPIPTAATPCPTTLASSAPGSTRSCKLADGQVVVLRPVRPSDAEPLLALFRRVSAETLRLRFFGCPRLELVEARAMAEVDHVDRDAVVACLGSEGDAPIIGIGSYDESRPGVAEIAFTVDDRYQGRGLGGHLLAWIIEAAEARGFERLHGEILTDNGRMLRLVSGSGYPCQLRRDIGSCRFSLTIGAGAMLPSAA